ncbi:MAG: hypothetical protein ACYCTZ_04440 [Candidatus Dormibacteria bacterium]
MNSGGAMDRIRNYDFDCRYTAEYLGEPRRYEQWWARRLGAAYVAAQIPSGRLSGSSGALEQLR